MERRSSEEHEGNFKLVAEKKEFEENKAEAIKELDKREKNIEIIVTGSVNVILGKERRKMEEHKLKLKDERTKVLEEMYKREIALRTREKRVVEREEKLIPKILFDESDVEEVTKKQRTE